MSKGTTNSGIPVFGEIVKLFDRQEINTLAKKMGANRYTKRLDAYQHLVIMLYASLSRFNSLREVEYGLNTAATRMNHFGLDYMVRRSTLSDANARRSPEFFARVYNLLYERYKRLLSDTRPVKGMKSRLFVMDSTTISLFSQVFRGTGRNATNGRKKGGVKAHTVISADEDVMAFMDITDAVTSDQSMLKGLWARLPAGSCVTFDMGYVNYGAWQELSDHGITYVTREKRRCKSVVTEPRPIPEEDKDVVTGDEIVTLSWRRRYERPITAEELSHRRGRRPKDGVIMVRENKSGKHKCRRIMKWKDNKDDGTITFITNDFDTPASVLCEVYRRRWQIETLFKRLKQNFCLKYFLGDNQNAIKIQIWVNMIAWLLMQVVKRMATRKWSMSNMMTAVRILLNSYIGLFDFLNTPEAQWMKIILARRKATETPTELSLFPDMRGPNFENKKTMAYLQAVTIQ